MQLADNISNDLLGIFEWVGQYATSAVEAERNEPDPSTDKSITLTFRQDISPQDVGIEYIDDEDGLISFLDELEEQIEQRGEGLEGYIYSILSRNEVINDPFFILWSKIEEEYMEDLDDGDWTFEADGDPYLINEQSFDVDMNDIYLGIEKVKGIPTEYKEEDIIREIVMGVFFRKAIRKRINKRTGIGENEVSNINDKTRIVFGDTPKVAYTMSFFVDSNVSHLESIIRKISREDMEDIILESYIEIVAEDMKKKGIKGGMFMDDKDFSPPSPEPQDDTSDQQQIPFEKESKKSLNERIHKNWINKLMN